MWLKYSGSPIDRRAFVDRPQADRISKYQKPNGCWITDDTEDCWRTWCVGESFGLESLTHKHEVTLDETNVLILRSASQLDKFSKQFSVARPWSWQGRDYVERCIDWRVVAARYDGLIITPYQWTHRLHEDYGWYYGWDCASGCIWKPSTILDIRLIEIDEEVAKPRKSNAA